MRKLALALLSLSLSAADYYASPTATSGTGTLVDPWTLAQVQAAALVAGDRVWFIGGSTCFQFPNGQTEFDLAGTVNARIQLIAVPGTKPCFESPTGQNASLGGFTLAGNYMDLIGMDLVFKGLLISDIPGSNPPTSVPSAIRVYDNSGNPTGNRVINNIVRSWDGAIDGIATTSDWSTRYYGNLVLNAGGISPDRAHGGAGYIQNEEGHTEEVLNNIFIAGNQLSYYNLRIRSATVGKASQVDVKYNIMIDSPAAASYVTDTVEPHLINWSNNFMRWGSTTPYLGEDNGDFIDGTIEDNYIVNISGGTIWRAVNTSIARNTFIPTSSSVAVVYRDMVSPTYTANNYRTSVATATKCLGVNTLGSVVYQENNGGNGLWASSWLASGKDAGGSCTGALPTTNKKTVDANIYEPGRANLAVYNWALATSETFDVSAVLTVGDPYEVYDAYSPSTVVASGTYAGGSITVPLTGTALWQPEASQLPTRCWMTSCATCYAVWPSGANTAAFGTSTALYQPAIISSGGTLNRIYYGNGSGGWTSSGATCVGVPNANLSRDAKMFAFILRRKQQAQPYTWSFNTPAGTTSVRLTYGYSPTNLDQPVLIGTGSGVIKVSAPPQLTGPIYAQWCYRNVSDTNLACSEVEKVTIQ